MTEINLKAIIDGLREKEMTVAFAESCTGGRLAADLTTIPGSSDVIMGSAVVYQIEAKKRILGLSAVTERNVVTLQTAKEMADAAREMFGSTIAIATTGYLDNKGEFVDTTEAVVAVSWPLGMTRAAYVEGMDPNFTRAINRELVIQHAMLELMIALKDTP